MKRLLFMLVTLVLALAVAVPMAAPVAGYTEAEPFSTDLIAGQSIDVGEVLVWNDGTNLYVKYELSQEGIDDGWEITETHLYVGKNVPPASTPGQFPYDDDDASGVPDTEVLYTVPLADIDSYSMVLNSKGKPTGVIIADGNPGMVACDADDVYVAAHAVVQRVIEDGYSDADCLVSDNATDNVLYLDEDPLNPGYPVGYTAPYQSYVGAATPSVLAWTHSAWAPYGIAGAQWISSSYLTENTDNNTWRLFTRNFSLPANAINIAGKLTANDDNGEEVYLNGTFVGDGSPAIVYGATVKDVTPPSGVQHGWSTVEGPWDVSSQLVAGSNELWTMTRNYAWSGGPTANPTGLIYKLCYSYDVPPVYQTETAWGNGTGFGTNWGMYFPYTLQCVEIVRFPEDGNVYVGYEDWINGDFDYNDFGMNFSVEEIYVGGDLTELTMTFTAVVYDSGMDHLIHIARPLNGAYAYDVSRSVAAYPGVLTLWDGATGQEKAAGSYTGSDNLDVVLFNTAKYGWPQKNINETVTIHVVLDSPSANPKTALTAPRSYNVGSGDFYDLDPMMANYDPWEEGTLYQSRYLIGDTQVISATGSQRYYPAGEIIPVGTEVPMILVVEETDWIPPFEDSTITGPYGLFNDFYTTGSPSNWYETQTNTTVGHGGLSWSP